MNSRIRLGITTRVTSNEEYRDCLAHDWTSYLNYILPEIDWIMLPNIGDSITSYVEKWELNSFIISGGNTLGESELRDKTEHNLIEYAKSHSMPLLGVCRGLQLLVSHFGGKLERPEHPLPIACHKVKYLESPYNYKLDFPAEVNSFHNCLIKDSGKLTPFISDDKNNIEGAYSKQYNIIGIGWHPERTSPSKDFDKTLLQNFFLQ